MKVVDLISKVRDGLSFKLTNSEAREVIDTYVNVLKEGMSNDDSVPLPGLGRFVMNKRSARAERKGRNPRTGEEITISAKPAYKTPVFKISKTARKELDQVLQ